MKKVKLAIKNIQWAGGAMLLSSAKREKWHLPVETVLAVEVGDDALMSRIMQAALYSLSEKYGQPDDGIEAVDFDVDWSNSTMDNNEPQDPPSTEPVIGIAKEDWKLLLRCAWCLAMDARDTALPLLLVRDQLKAPEGKLARISLLDTPCLECMLVELGNEREKIEQWVKPAFPPMQEEILETVESMIRSELDRRTDEKDVEGHDGTHM